MWRAYGVFLAGLARAESGVPGGGLEEMRRGAELLREQNVLIFDGLVQNLRWPRLKPGRAMSAEPSRSDEALASCERTGHRAFEAELHRVRGEMLLKRDPANPAPAEEASRPPSPSRSGKPRAASVCARRCRSQNSTNRPAARSRRTTFSRPRSKVFRRRRKCRRSPRRRRCSRRLRRPTKSRRIGAATTDGAIAGGLRQRAHCAGASAPETTEAFAKARKSAHGEKDAPERLAADYGLWAGSHLRGELAAMRAHAAAFLSDVEARPNSPEAGVAYRAAGSTAGSPESIVKREII